MKKYFLVLLVLFSAVCGLYADSDHDPFDKLAEKLLDDFEDIDCTIAVKVFNSDLGNNERKRISPENFVKTWRNSIKSSVILSSGITFSRSKKFLYYRQLSAIIFL